MSFTFRSKIHEITSGQFQLVRRSDLHVPLVVLKSGVDVPLFTANAQNFLEAKFVVNAYKCAFHQRKPGSQLDCPTYSEGHCFCGVDELYEAMIDEMEKASRSKFSKRERRWMDHRKLTLLQKHQNVFLLEAVAGQTPATASRGRKADGARGGINLAPSEDEVSKLFQIYKTKSIDSLSLEKQRVVYLAEKIAEEMDKDRRCYLDHVCLKTHGGFFLWHDHILSGVQSKSKTLV